MPGLPQNVELVHEVPRLPQRPADFHKGQAGHVALLAGSRGMSGAAVLCGVGALRGGAGLVRVHCPGSILPLVAQANPCLMTVPLPEDESGRLRDAARLKELVTWDWASAVGIGPGLGQSDEVRECVLAALETADCPVVVDADGLNHLSGITLDAGKRRAAPLDWWSARRGRVTVVTPHPGEMARLRAAARLAERKGSGDDERLTTAYEYAALTGTVVVLKGRRTVVAAAERAYVNNTGNPGMATGGMGDVLTGLISALVAQGMEACEAACLGVWLHGRAADLLSRQLGPIGYLAHEVADMLPAALAEAAREPIGFR